MTISKKLTSKSGLTIPKQIRAELGYLPGMGVDLETTDKGLLIKPHVPICRFCGRPEDILHIADINLCKACADAFVLEVKSYGNE